MGKKWVARILLGAAVVLVGVGTGPAGLQAVPLLTVSLAVSPTTYNGACPVQITYTIGFKVTGFCSINYHLVNAKGKASQAFTMSCKSAGTYKAVKTLPATATFSGWVAVRVTSPVIVQSNQVTLNIKCQPMPKITSARLDYGGDPVPEIDISGSGFGTQGTQSIQVDGVPISTKPGWNVLQWTNTLITINTTGVTPWEHTYNLALTDGGTVVSNVFSVRFPYAIDGLTPGSGWPGRTVKVTIWSLPPAQGSYILTMGGYNTMPVSSWGNGSVTAIVPANLPAGTHNIVMYKNERVVSNSVPFLVVPKPHIDRVTWTVVNVHSSTQVISAYGTNFGQNQGTKKLRIGNLPGWNISAYMGDALEAIGPNNIVPWTETYPVTLADGNEDISNTVQVRFPYYINTESGYGVAPGSVVKLCVYGLPAAPGTLTLKWEVTPLEIVSWQSPHIEFRAPSLPPGSHGRVALYDGNTKASKDMLGSFKII